MIKQQKQHGLALLVAVLAVGVVLTIGLSLLETTIIQAQIASSARDSEVAFTAAQAAAECAQEIRDEHLSELRDFSTPMPAVYCMTGGVTPFSSTEPNSYVYRYQYEVTYGSPSQCAEIDMFIYDAEAAGSSLTTNLPNYSPDPVCPDNGGVCTAIFARGYNRACGVDTGRVMEREIFIRY